MEKSKSKKKRGAEKPPLNVTSQLAMPERLLPWERDLLAVLLEVVDGSAQRDEKKSKGKSKGSGLDKRHFIE